MIINQTNQFIYYTINITAILIGLLYIIVSLKKEKIDNKKIIIFFITFLLSSIIMAKLYTMITSETKISFIKAGFSGYGGLFGAIISTIIYEKIYSLKGKVLKYTILSLPLIYSLSKLSCFIYGCCHGIPYHGLLAINYPFLGNETYFPIQLLETIVFMFIFQICHIKKNHKDIIYITLILISIFKFSLDFLRYEHITKIITPNQIFSIILLIISLIILIIKKKTAK